MIELEHCLKVQQLKWESFLNVLLLVEVFKGALLRTQTVAELIVHFITSNCGKLHFWWLLDTVHVNFDCMAVDTFF